MRVRVRVRVRQGAPDCANQVSSFRSIVAPKLSELETNMYLLRGKGVWHGKGIEDRRRETGGGRQEAGGGRQVGGGSVLEALSEQLVQSARAHQRRVEVAVAGRAPLVVRVGRPRRWRQVHLGNLGRLG